MGILLAFSGEIIVGMWGHNYASLFKRRDVYGNIVILRLVIGIF